MPIISTELFRFTTAADPDCVWDALTHPALTARYLHGLSASSEWTPGAAIDFGAPDGPFALVGEVLFAERPCRLSYALADLSGDPTVYVTWEVRPGALGSVVHLQVDEPHAAGDDDVELAWLPVVAALEEVLVQCIR